MIVLISFPELERTLFGKAAQELDIAQHVRYVDPEDATNMAVLHAHKHGGKGFPKVLILNLDDKTNDWRDVLSTLKAHEDWQKIPVMGFSFLTDNSIVEEFYRLRGASVIRKPQTYADLLMITKNAMRYWLNVATLPDEILAS